MSLRGCLTRRRGSFFIVLARVLQAPMKVMTPAAIDKGSAIYRLMK